MHLEMLDPQGLAFCVHDFMAPAECRAFITMSEAHSYGPAPLTTARGPVMAPDVRNNTRVMVDDHSLAASLWQRVQPFVPPLLHDWSDSLREPIGLNERFRFFRYDPQQRFAPHYDGTYDRGNGEVSMLTFMVYLNDGFEGGETNFYTAREQLKYAVKPRQGSALFFIHNINHEGARVRAGRKYVLRSDVMYKRI